MSESDGLSGATLPSASANSEDEAPEDLVEETETEGREEWSERGGDDDGIPVKPAFLREASRPRVAKGASGSESWSGGA